MWLLHSDCVVWSPSPSYPSELGHQANPPHSAHVHVQCFVVVSTCFDHWSVYLLTLPHYSQNKVLHQLDQRRSEVVSPCGLMLPLGSHNIVCSLLTNDFKLETKWVLGFTVASTCGWTHVWVSGCGHWWPQLCDSATSRVKFSGIIQLWVGSVRSIIGSFPIHAEMHALAIII